MSIKIQQCNWNQMFLFELDFPLKPCLIMIPKHLVLKSRNWQIHVPDVVCATQWYKKQENAFLFVLKFLH